MKFLTFLLLSLAAFLFYWVITLVLYHWESRANARHIEDQIRASRQRMEELRARQVHDDLPPFFRGASRR